MKIIKILLVVVSVLALLSCAALNIHRPPSGEPPETCDPLEGSQRFSCIARVTGIGSSFEWELFSKECGINRKLYAVYEGTRLTAGCYSKNAVRQYNKGYQRPYSRKRQVTKAPVESTQPNLNTELSKFLKSSSVLQPDQFGKRVSYGKIVRYEASSDSNGLSKEENFLRHKEDIISRGFSCTKRKHLKKDWSGRLQPGITIPTSDKWNYISVICKGDCENLYYSVLADRNSVFTHKGNQNFPKLLAIGTQTLTLDLKIGLRFAQIKRNEFYPIDPYNTSISVIHWEKTLGGALAGYSCGMMY